MAGPRTGSGSAIGLKLAGTGSDIGLAPPGGVSTEAAASSAASSRWRLRKALCLSKRSSLPSGLSRWVLLAVLRLTRRASALHVFPQ